MRFAFASSIPPWWQPGRDVKRTFHSPLLHQFQSTASIKSQMLEAWSNFPSWRSNDLLGTATVEIRFDVFRTKTDGSATIANAVHRQLACFDDLVNETGRHAQPVSHFSDRQEAFRLILLVRH